MIKTDVKLSRMLMSDMGLTEDENHRIVDLESGEICAMGTKDVVAPGYSERSTIEFDPINNPRLMNTLFMEFIDKLQEEEVIEEAPISFGTYQVPGTNKNVARITMDNGTTIESRPYKTEGLCYAELVKKLNGDEDDDFTKYDSLNRKTPASIKPRRR